MFDLRRHNRRSICIKGYDYRQAGLYFITMCCYKRLRLFGNVVDGKMELNDAGKIANECWLAIPDHFPHVVLHECVIMPNHVHGIVEPRRGEMFFAQFHEQQFTQFREYRFIQSHK